MDNTDTIRQAARLLTDAMSDNVQEVHRNGGRYIHSGWLEEITNTLQAVIAEVVATIIDAGSERDAVMENEELHKAILNELYGWTYAAEENS